MADRMPIDSGFNVPFAAVANIATIIRMLFIIALVISVCCLRMYGASTLGVVMGAPNLQASDHDSAAVGSGASNLCGRLWSVGRVSCGALSSDN